MLKKCLIALVLVAISTAPTFAHVMWNYGVTTSVQWEWETHFGPEICVKMKVVMWAQLYFCDDEDVCLILKQQSNGDFMDCICMELCVNFSGINVTAKYIPSVDIVTTKDNKGYAISVEDMGDAPSWSGWAAQPSDTLHVDTIHLTGNNKKIEICLKAKDVDPQAMEYNNLQAVLIGKVITSLTPTLAPPGEPANGIIATGGMFNQIP
jgi:hypothetical protein